MKPMIAFAPCLFAAHFSASAEGVCTAWVSLPESASVSTQALLAGALERCQVGYVCEIPNCSGRIEPGPFAVQVFYRSPDNRSKVHEVAPGDSLLLEDLHADTSLTSAIRNLLGVFKSDAPDAASGGRYALRPTAAGKEIPAGQVAVFGDGISFSIADVPAAAYIFHPQDAPSALNRIAPVDGVFHIDSGSLIPGQRYQGGVEGSALVPFQIAPQDKLERVIAEIEAATPNLSPTAELYRRALIYFDSGLGWNARRELAALSGN